MALHLSPEYLEGQLAGIESFLHPDRPPKNPYDFFDAYTKHYAWDIGFQAARTRIRERRLTPLDAQAARQEGAKALLRQLFPPPGS